ncbi:transmembrane protein 45B-like [Branchiostoma floridae]|uniref:Transmembrane protein 45B-like n=1 Tax=Branchiostoma floridae TaxID=7739 RepID=A0A9J7MB86_BRAFL|nr:transmembrane protein 45B-like [Branchiostoma floridae]
MGDFIGHAVPGTILLLFGLWWSIKYSVRWASRVRGRETSSAAARCNCGPSRFLKRLPVEGLCKTILGTSGIFLEQHVGNWTLIDPVTSEFHMVGIWQHTTMDLFLVLNGFCDVVIALGAPVPRGIDHVSLSMAYAVEGLLFFYHVHGRTCVDVRLHMLLVLAAGLCAAASGLEAWKSDILLLPMLRTACTLQQGTWFWQIAFILYSPFPGHDWDLDSHENMMFVSMAFCWHLLGVLLFMCVVYTVVYHIYRAKEKQLGTDMELGLMQTHSDSDMDQ